METIGRRISEKQSEARPHLSAAGGLHQFTISKILRVTIHEENTPEQLEDSSGKVVVLRKCVQNPATGSISTKYHEVILL